MDEPDLDLAVADLFESVVELVWDVRCDPGEVPGFLRAREAMRAGV